MRIIISIFLVMLSICSTASNLDSIVTVSGNNIVVYKYDSNGRKVSETEYESGKLYSQLLTEYDSIGNKVSYSNITYFNSVNNIGTVSKYFYDNKFKLVGECGYVIIDGVTEKSDSI